MHLFYLIAIILLSLSSAKSISHKPGVILKSKPVDVAKQHVFLRETDQILPPCNDDELMCYLAQLKAVNPESIINLSTENDLPIVCGDLSDKLDRIDDYLGTCKVIQQGLYVQLIKGVDALYDYLCNSSHTSAFLQHFSCYKSLHNDYASCTGPADWTEFSEKHKICSAYQDIIDCYYIKTAKVCGIRAAKVMKAMNKAVINRIIPVKCCIHMNPYVRDAFPNSSAACNFFQVSLYVALLSIIFIEYC